MPNSPSQIDLDIFYPTNYFFNKSRHIMLFPESIPLIAQYYTDKYSTDISLVNSGDLDETKKVIKDVLEQVRLRASNQDEYRHAFIVINAGHAVSITYIKDKQEEGLLVADSLGEEEGIGSSMLASWLHKEVGIDIYKVKEKRQADEFSCFSDALVIGRETTKKNSKGQYLLPDLFTQLKSRSIPEEGQYATLLPNELLKTAQISSFIAINKEADNKIVHQHKEKKENLEEFIKRYRKPVFLIGGKKSNLISRDKTQTEEEFIEKHKSNTALIKSEIHGYLVEKGLKYSDIIEIQFYINQIKKLAGDLFTNDKQQDFIKAAKQEVNKNKKISTGRLHKLTTEFCDGLMSNKPKNKP